MLLLIWLTLLLAPVSLAGCTAADTAIHARIGSTFSTLFRSYVGWWPVSKADYEARIVAETGLSPGCAACYGEAYICGWDHCKAGCFVAGETCNGCLAEHGCVSRCNKCTGF